MTEHEANSLLKAASGQICTRLFRRQDGTVLTEDCPVSWNALKRRASKAASIVLSTAISFCAPVFAQDQAQSTRAISGKVSDAMGSVIANASVKLSEITKHTELNGKTDGKGTFQFANLPVGVYTVAVQSPGFENFKKDNLNLILNSQPDLKITLNVGTVGAPIFVETKHK